MYRFHSFFNGFPNGRIQPAFSLFRGLFIPLIFLGVGKYSRLLAGFGKPTQCFFKRFSGTHDYPCHLLFHLVSVMDLETFLAAKRYHQARGYVNKYESVTTMISTIWKTLETAFLNLVIR